MADTQLIDALGRVLETKLGDPLEALAKAMNDMVTKVTAKGSTNTKSVDKFVELIEDKDKKLEDFSDYLKTKMPQAFKNLKEEVDKVKDQIESWGKSLATIQSNAKGGGGGEKGEGGNCDCQSIMDTIKANTTTISTILNGGIKLEDEAMNVLRSINFRLKKIADNVAVSPSSSGNMSARSSKPVSANVPETSINQKPELDQNKSLGIINNKAQAAEDANVEKALKKRIKSIKTLSWAQSDFIDGVSELASKLENSGDDKKLARLNRQNYILQKQLDNITSAENEISAISRRQLKNEMLRLKVMIELGKSTEEIEKQYQKVQTIASSVNKNLERWRTGMLAVNSVLGMAINSFASYSNTVFGGLISDLKEWEQETTRMAATMTGSIHSANAESNRLVHSYRSLLQVSDDVVRSAHQFPAVIRKEWLKQIKKGTRGIYETKAAVNSALAAAWQVGASAEGTADEFQKWNMEIGMSAEGSVSLARTMTATAKMTGVMGDNLLQAVTSAREIAQQMKDTGLYSQQTANSVVGWMASAQKFGVDKQVQNIFKASQGGLEAFNQASAETRNLLASSGQLQNILAGDADPDKVMKGVGDAIRNAIPRNAFKDFDKEGKPVGVPDLTKLSKSEISRLDLIMKNRFGMKLGESVRLLEGIRDQNPEEKLAQIENDLKNPRMTKAEKEQLELEKAQLKIAIKEKSLSKSLDSLSAVSNGLKELPKDNAEAMKTVQELVKNNKVDSSTISESSKLLGEKLERQGKTFEQSMNMSQSSFNSQMNSALQGLQSTDEATRNASALQFRELQNKLAEANKLADSNAKNDSNASDKLETQAMSLQNIIQNFVRPAFTFLSQLPLIAINTALIVGGLIGILKFFYSSRMSENMQKTADTLINTIGTKGSGWVHDPYVEHFVENIDKNIFKLSKKMGVVDARRVRKKEDSTSTTPGISKLTDKLGILGTVIDHVTGGFGSITETVKGYFMDLFTGSGSIKEGLAKVFGQAQESLKKGYDTSKEYLTGKSKGGIPDNLSPSTATDKAASKSSKKKESVLGKSKAKTPEVPKMSPKLDQAGGMFKDSAAKLAALGAGILVLGAVLVGLTVALMKLTGFSAKDAQDVAWVMGVIIGGAAAVLLATAGAAKIMQWANKSIKWKDIKDIYMGGLILTAILPALALLGLAIVGMGALLSTMISPKKAEEYAQAVSGILLSASIVSLSVLLAAGSLAVLGLLASSATALVPLMALGAVALLLLTPAMLLLASAVIGIASGIAKTVDPKWAASAAKATADIMWSAATIAASVVISSASLMALSGLALIAPVAIPLMLMGAEVLLLLTPAMLLMAKAVIGMAAISNAMVDPKMAMETAKNTADIMWAAGKIAVSVLAASAILTGLGAMVLGVWVLIPLMMAGAAVLAALTPVVVKIGMTIINMISELAAVSGMKEKVSSAVEVMSSLGSAIEAIGKTMVVLNEKITPLVEPQRFLFVATGPSVLEKLKNSMSLFSEYFKSISGSLIDGIIKPVTERFPQSSEITEVSNQLQSTLKVLDMLPRFISDLALRMNTLASAQYWNYNLSGTTQVFSNWFYGIGSSLSNGIFTPLSNMPNVSEIEQACETLTQVTNALTELMNVMTHLSELLAEMSSISINFNDLNNVGGIFKAGKLELTIKAREEVGRTDDGWMEQLLGVFTGRGSPSVSDSGGLLRGMRRGVGQAVEKPIDKVNTTTGRVGDGVNKVDTSINKISKSNDYGPKIDAFKEMVHTDIGTILAQLKLSEDSDEQPLGEMLDERLAILVDKTTSIDLKLSGIQASLNEFNQAGRALINLEDEATNGSSLDTHDHTLEDLLLKYILPNVEKISTFSDQSSEMMLGSLLESANNINETLNSIYSSLEETMIAKILPHIEKAPEVQNEQVKPTVSNDEFDKRIQARVEELRPSASMTAATDYLAEIAANTAQTVEEMKEAVEVLQEIRGLLKAPGDSSSPNTASNKKPRSTPNFFSWQFGRFGDTAAKQYNNPGV